MKKIIMFCCFLITVAAISQNSKTARLLFDFHPGTANGSPRNFKVANGRALFNATEFSTSNYHPVCVTDGTVSGTAYVGTGSRAFPDTDPNLNPNIFAVTDTNILITPRRFPTTTDIIDFFDLGTNTFLNNTSTAGSGNSNEAGGFIEVGGQVIFHSKDSSGDMELYISDGTTAGTELFQDINPNGSSNPGWEIKHTNDTGGELYVFTAATDNNNTRQVFAALEIFSIKLLIPTTNFSAGAAPQNLKQVGDFVYFSAVTPTEGRELWRVDLSDINNIPPAELVADVNPGAASSNPIDVVEYNGDIYFSAIGATGGRSLFRHNLSSSSTQQILTNNPTVEVLGEPQSFLVVNGNLYFTAITFGGSFGARRQLWEIDNFGTTNKLTNLSGEVLGENFSQMVVKNDDIYFVGRRLSNAGAVFVYDTTNNSLERVISNNDADAFPLNLQIVNNNVIASLDRVDVGQELFVIEESNCINPTLSGSNITFTPSENSVDISWTPPNAMVNSYKCYVFTDNANPETDTPVDSFILSVGNNLVNGLDANTPYDVYVRSVCNNTESTFSKVSNKLEFTTDSVLNLEDITQLNSATLHPNPVKDNFTIRGNDLNIEAIKVFGILGNRVLTLMPNDSNVYNVYNLEKGIYFVRLQTADGKTFTKKIVKE
ncbi:T9SS type A sorting domain-containing protein [Winogradskyella litorisediminis]|uniref:T9SS type A sorting domain-containing protein n=1 Tax=Winogradskyella litorisediminis TaxID=1156618 RepID=A0ABW3N3D3_9FLAO